MALFSQDFTKFQKDTFDIKFTITDATVSLTGYEAWWGCYSGDVGNYPSTNTPVIEKATAGWTSGAAGAGITMGSNYILVSLTQADFNGNSVTNKLTEGEYYHELVDDLVLQLQFVRGLHHFDFHILLISFLQMFYP